MTKSIRSYEDLLKEKQQLEFLLLAQKELVVQDISELKLQLAPAVDTLSFIGKLITKDKTNLLLNGGADRLMDIVLKKILLVRAGWVTRLLVPYFMKNYSSHFIAKHKDRLMEKLFSWINHKNGNGYAAPDPAARTEA